MKRALLIAALAATLSGCAKPPAQLETLQASRADGVVTMGYNVNHATRFVRFGELQDFAGAEGTASRVCQGWGYTGASAIDPQPHLNCAHHIFDQCDTGVVYQQYQCTGAGRPQ